jgi:hypothetical protein
VVVVRAWALWVATADLGWILAVQHEHPLERRKPRFLRIIGQLHTHTQQQQQHTRELARHIPTQTETHNGADTIINTHMRVDALATAGCLARSLSLSLTLSVRTCLKDENRAQL